MVARTIESSVKTGFLIAQQHFFDNSKSRFTANSELSACGESNIRICGRSAP
jgi:hypothetical protein